MKSVTRTALPLLLAGATLAGGANAALVSRNFEWVGTTGLNGYNAGYTASGAFTYDDAFGVIAAEGVSNGNFNNGLESLTISFFDDLGAHLATFNDVVGGVINYEFLTFQFDTVTQQFTNKFDLGQDIGDVFDHYIAGTIGGQSWLVEADTLDDLNTILTGTTISVSAVPVPAAAWLFGSGLVGLVGAAGRNKQAL